MSRHQFEDAVALADILMESGYQVEASAFSALVAARRGEPDSSRRNGNAALKRVDSRDDDDHQNSLRKISEFCERLTFQEAELPKGGTPSGALKTAHLRTLENRTLMLSGILFRKRIDFRR